MRFTPLLFIVFLAVIGCSKDKATEPTNHAPQITSVTSSPDSVWLSGSTTLSCVATDADSDSIGYVWSCPQGSFPNGVASASVAWQAPATAGSCAVSVTVSDGEKTASGSKVVTVWTFPQGSQPGEERTFPLGNTGLTIRMCWVPAGSFQMGRMPGEQDSDDFEDPRHLVTLERGFWMSKYEVTQAQWQTVMGSNRSRFHGDNLPVEFVSWYDIQVFESELHDLFRLPSESEWEYACRAGTTTRFYWGDDPSYSQIGNYAWYNGNSGSTTHPVGTKTANAWGLCDMIGNVWEWCEDWEHSSYTGAPIDGSAWIAGGGSYRDLRGCCRDDSAHYCRSASRFWNRPYDHGITNNGFRVCEGF